MYGNNTVHPTHQVTDASSAYGVTDRVTNGVTMTRKRNKVNIASRVALQTLPSTRNYNQRREQNASESGRQLEFQLEHQFNLPQTNTSNNQLRQPMPPKMLEEFFAKQEYQHQPSRNRVNTQNHNINRNTGAYHFYAYRYMNLLSVTFEF